MSERRVQRKAPASTTQDASSGKEEMTILDESEFTFQVDRIVARDFFPDLKRLKAQGEELGLGSEDDAVATTADASSQNEERLDSGRDMSLDQFLSTHTSEDNASFGRLVETETEQRRRAYERMVGGNSSSKLTSSGECNNSTRKGLETWKYTARNALMFMPTAHVTTGGGNNRSGTARILAHNTRLPEDFGSGDDQSNWDIESVDGDATPMINGYKLVREPTSISSSRRSSKAYGQGKTRGFKIGETPEREKLAQQLSKPRMAQKNAIKNKPARSGSSSGRQAAQKLAMLSPAAQRLLGGSGGNGFDTTPKARQGNNDHELRKAYNSPYVRRDSPTQRRL